MCNEPMSLRLALLVSVVVGVGAMSCTEDKPRANFEPCPTLTPQRDIVFLIDQSKSVWDNDTEGVRWDALINLAGSIFDDERKSISSLTNGLVDTLRTRLAFIPFGGQKETQRYLQQFPLRWFDRTGYGELANVYLKTLQAGSLRREDMADSTDFWSAFARLGQAPIQWREGADRYVFLLTDGKYDPDNTRCFEPAERARFARMLAQLRQHAGAWPVYFVAFGKSGYEIDTKDCREPFVHVALMEQMAEALPLPDTLQDGMPRPTFSIQSRGKNNLATFISDDADWTRQQLQDQLHIVLRSALPLQVAPSTNGRINLPRADPRHVEISLDVSPSVSTHELANRLNLFFRTPRGDTTFSPLPAVLDAGDRPSTMHTLIADPQALLGIIPSADTERTFVPESWGIELRDHSITLKRVNLKMHYNWSVFTESCYFEQLSVERSFWRRLRNVPEPPKYKLVIDVRAEHPCEGVLPRGRLKIVVEGSGDSIVDDNEPEKVNWRRREGDVELAETRHIYRWKYEIEDLSIFAKRVGRPVHVRLIFEDLYDYSIDLHPDVPVNGRRVNSPGTNE